ncbi:hypothetical protein PVAP13_2NG652001 [Panicum virgatum]|uniref:Alpha/beta hydrolase fold-3 domain-containing protein n=1 Tax=Panicum virgatum TaxID=38727 RepID=A0A8T0VW27_PANVG|nr:hypothetical protein PVAP13_2NG652001 [Panicum virgatum]
MAVATCIGQRFSLHLVVSVPCRRAKSLLPGEQVKWPAALTMTAPGAGRRHCRGRCACSWPRSRSCTDRTAASGASSSPSATSSRAPARARTSPGCAPPTSPSTRPAASGRASSPRRWLMRTRTRRSPSSSTSTAVVRPLLRGVPALRRVLPPPLQGAPRRRRVRQLPPRPRAPLPLRVQRRRRRTPLPRCQPPAGRRGHRARRPLQLLPGRRQRGRQHRAPRGAALGVHVPDVARGEPPRRRRRPDPALLRRGGADGRRGHARQGVLVVGGGDGSLLAGVPAGATRDHEAARVCGDGVELAEAFPPAMVVIGGFDLLKDWQARYVEALRRKGKPLRVVEYPDAVHGFHAFPELADSGKLVEMKLFVKEHRSKRAV